MFDYEPLTADLAPRGTVGIPRVLNMYETTRSGQGGLLQGTGLPHRSVPKSTRQIYELGIESIRANPNATRQKLAQCHIEWLIRQGLTYIFYPCVLMSATKPGSRKSLQLPDGHILRGKHQNNVESLTDHKVHFRESVYGIYK